MPKRLLYLMQSFAGRQIGKCFKLILVMLRAQRVSHMGDLGPPAQSLCCSSWAAATAFDAVYAPAYATFLPSPPWFHLTDPTCSQDCFPSHHLYSSPYPYLLHLKIF